MINANKPLVLTPDEIQEWQSADKYGRKISQLVYLVDENNPEGEKDIFFVVNPTRTAVQAISDMARKNDTTEKINHLTINSSVLAGPIQKLETDDALYYGLLGDITELGNVKKRVS